MRIEEKRGFTPLEIGSISTVNGNASSRITRRKRFLSLTGFTLTEVLIAATLISFIIAVAWGFYNTSIRFSRSAVLQIGVQNEAAIAMEHMVNNIMVGNLVEVENVGGEPYFVRVRVDRDANYRPNPKESLTQNKISDLGNPKPNCSDDIWITYRYFPGDRTIRFKNDYAINGCNPGPHPGAPTGEIIARNIYPPPGGEPMFEIGGAQSSRLNIRLVAQDDPISPENFTDLTSAVTLRLKPIIPYSGP